MTFLKEQLGEGLSRSQIYAVLGSKLLASQKIILLILEAVQRPISEREIMEILGYTWPTYRGTISRQMKYLIHTGTVSLDKSRMPHRYSLSRVA